MSTKAIREALEWMRSDGYTVNDALAEVEAIEQAAVDISEHGSLYSKDESLLLLHRIAEQD